MAAESPQPLRMPGSYASLLPPTLDTCTESKTYFYSSSPQTPGLRRRQLDGQPGTGESKKRLRHGEYGNGNAWFDSSSVGTLDHLNDRRSPPPLVNDRYELAGGTDSHHTLTKNSREEDDYFHLEKQRRGVWSLPTSPSMDANRLLVGHEALHSSPNGDKSWVLSQLFNIVGGVAGKLVQFCSVPFRGFQAGGGQGYSFDSRGSITEKTTCGYFDINAPTADGVEVSSPYPGTFPVDDYGVASLDSVDDATVRSSKRLCRGDSWVVVDSMGGMNSRASSPRLSERRAPTTNTPQSPSRIPRPASSRTNSTKGIRGRPSLIPVSRRISQDRYPRTSQTGSPTARPSKKAASPRAYSRQSYGSPALFPSNSTSPLPKESQRLVNKLRREEMEDEARVRRMSAQMSAMLKEAKEALGSRIEIEDGGDYLDSGNLMEDEGYSEDASMNNRAYGGWSMR